MPGQRSGDDYLVQRRERSHGKGNSRLRFEAGRKIDARAKTGTAPDGAPDMRSKPANESRITDVSRLRSYRCTIIVPKTSTKFMRRTSGYASRT
jgi:hypothetical protein